MTTRISHSRSAHGFSRVELVSVLASFILLIALALPLLARDKQTSRRLLCLNNLRQMAVGSLMYAESDSQGRLTGSLATTGSQQAADDDLNWLYGFENASLPRRSFVNDLNTFLCPSTQNRIRSDIKIPSSHNGYTFTRLNDLINNATSTTLPGHSYEVKGNWATSAYPRKTLRSVQTYIHQSFQFRGIVAGPASTFLIIDAMEGGTIGTREDYPNASNNHGRDGGNVAFADGHAEWIGSADWNYRYVYSEDSTSPTTPYD